MNPFNPISESFGLIQIDRIHSDCQFGLILNAPKLIRINPNLQSEWIRSIRIRNHSDCKFGLILINFGAMNPVNLINSNFQLGLIFKREIVFYTYLKTIEDDFSCFSCGTSKLRSKNGSFFSEVFRQSKHSTVETKVPPKMEPRPENFPSSGVWHVWKKKN